MKQKQIFTIIALLLLSISILFVYHFPDYYAWQNTPSGKSFSGQASWFDPWDINVYVAAIRWGQGHGLLLQNTYTAQTHPSVLMYPVYTLTGFAFPQTSPQLLFHLAAIISGFILLVTLWFLCRIFLKARFISLMATIAIALGGGVGWLFFPNFQSSDLYITGFTFASQFQRPHEAFGIIFYLLSLVSFYLATKEETRKWLVFSLISLGFLVIFYPYYLASFAIIAGLYSLILYFRDGEKKPFFNFLLIFTPAVIVFWAYFLSLKGNNGFSGVLSQNLTTPNIFQIISGYGVLTPLLIYQFIKKPKGEGVMFLNVWFITSIILAFIPLGFARFYLRGLFFPGIILSVFALDQISKTSKLPLKILIGLFLVLTSISSFFMFSERIQEVKKDNHWFYLSIDEKNALDYLADKDNAGVLSGYTLGNYIPANTKARVYFGHLLQTPHASEKIQNLAAFYSQKVSTESAKRFLDQADITYIVWGEEEKQLGQNPQAKVLGYSFLKPVFQSKDLIIYSKD